MKFLYALPVILFYLVGCGSSNYGFYSGGGNQCADGYDPLKTDMTKDDPDNFNGPNSKVNGIAGLPPGNYQFNGSEVYFKDTSNNIQIHTKIPANPDHSTANATIQCVANMNLVRDKAMASRSRTVATSFTITGDKNDASSWKVSTLNAADLGFLYDFHADAPEQSSLKLAVSVGIASPTTLAQIYSDYDSLQVYCVGPCGPKDYVRQYQIRASRQRTDDKDGHVVFIETMSSFIVDNTPKP